MRKTSCISGILTITLLQGTKHRSPRINGTTGSKRWNTILHIATREEFDHAMNDLLEGAEYATPLVMRQYIKMTWLPLRDQFARPWTKHYRHIGTTSTSRADATHARIKKIHRGLDG